ncbi:MAG: hypothetical protein KKD74_06485 [Bacteroidetes bacterium]|nr:hypothetical protein [Bacteroidales bacterium]MBU1009765.1 hypothetical protein [Bacteroidota bacterium]
MKKQLIFSLAISGMILFFSACKKDSGTTDPSEFYVPTAADVTASATLEELQQGRTLFLNNCGECHVLYSPDKYNVGQWQEKLSVMIPRTPMTAAEGLLVTKYLTRGKI